MSSMELLRSQALYLAPFLNSVIVYFVFVHDPHGELHTTLLKSAPIVFLMFYILLKGINTTKKYKCSQRILIGLLFSCAGDVLLNIDLFPHGMGAFAVAQIFYTSAFGWNPIKWKVGIALYIVGVIGVGIVFKGLDPLLKFGVPVYAVLLLTMCWRSVARGLHTKTFLNVFCAIGSVLFLISDCLISINLFYIQVPYARILIMSTYYLAQFAITLSTANECRSGGISAKQSNASTINNSVNGNENTRRRVISRD